MKVICNRGALLEALGVVGQAVQSRTPKPVLQCVKLDAEKDGMTLTATNLELAVRYRDSQVEVKEAGTVLLPADKLRDIVRESVDDTLSIEVEKDQAVIRGADSEFKVFTQPVGDFPDVADVEGEPDFQIAGGPLKGLIGRTLFAAAREGTRYAFNGVLMHAADGDLTFVATDGRRLALAKTPVSGGTGEQGDKPASPIVPREALNLLEKLLNDPEEMVGVQLLGNRIAFKTPDATVTSNLVEGTFPPYKDVIPKDNDKALTAACSDLMSAIKRAALLTNEESKGVRMKFAEGGVELTSRNPDAGEAKVNFAGKFEGDDVEIGFNPQFFTDALKVVDTDEVRFELSAANRPGLLKAGEDFLYVIMPVNLT
jgi:DNA polymerase-3 subunit beta